MAALVITNQQGQRQDLDLDERRRYTLGRAHGNDVVLTDLALSRRHAEVYFEDGAWMVADCGSSNGTFMDGRRLAAPARLGETARVSMGACILSLRLDQDADPDLTLSSPGTLIHSAQELIGLAAAPPGGERSGPDQEIDTLRRRFLIVQKATLELLAHEPIDALLAKILDQVFDAVRPDRAALLTLDARGDLVRRAYRGEGRDRMPISRTITDAVVSQKASVLTADARADERFAEARSVVFQGIRSVMAVPLWSEQAVIGLIYADSCMGDKPFTEEDLKLLTMLGNIAAIQIQNAMLFEQQVEQRRLANEARAAAEIQARLLPTHPPSIPGYSFTGHNSPCHEVGGDYFDCLPLGDGRHGGIIADVAGKGMGAALVMASLQATFCSRADAAPGPKELIDHLNRALAQRVPANRFVTLFYFELDPFGHHVRYVNAGHAPPPLVARASGGTILLEPSGPPLGVFPDFDYAVDELDLFPGDVLFACSDGVTDIVSPDGEMFGMDRLRRLVAEMSGRPAAEIRSALDQRLRTHARDTPQPDDLTVMVLRRDA